MTQPLIFHYLILDLPFSLDSQRIKRKVNFTMIQNGNLHCTQSLLCSSGALGLQQKIVLNITQ